MYLLYSILFSVGVVLMAPFYWWKKGRAQGRANWGERFGNIPIHETERGAIWVHAVSLGETLAVAGLVKEMQEAFPKRKIYLSHVTPTGREAGEKRLPTIAGRFYAPLDWGWTARKVVRGIKPSLLVIAETEIWPNLIHEAKESGAKVVIINARMSDRSFRRYSLVRGFMRRVFSDVDTIYAQTEQDADRFRQLVSDPQRVHVVGNLKFDARPPQLGEFAHAVKAALQQTNRRPVFVAASTMPGEEPLVLEAWDEILTRYPAALLILAPRHPARFDEVSRELAQSGHKHLRRTTQTTEAQAIAQQLEATPILLLDTIGELAGIFELADMVFMGGSLVPTGGHNILEPAYWSKVIAFGPHMENFRDIAKMFLDAGAAIQVRNPHELAQASLLLENREACENMGRAARKVLETHSGATARTLEGLGRYLEPESSNQTPASPEAS